MPMFDFEISTPAGTTKENPKITKIDLMKGVIDQWLIVVRPGHMGECFLRIMRGSDLVIPYNQGVWINGNDLKLQGPDWRYLKTPPYILECHTYNIDTVNDHAFDIYIFMKPLWTYTIYNDVIMRLMEEEELGKLVL